jgi:hypothetical protein
LTGLTTAVAAAAPAAPAAKKGKVAAAPAAAPAAAAAPAPAATSSSSSSSSGSSGAVAAAAVTIPVEKGLLESGKLGGTLTVHEDYAWLGNQVDISGAANKNKCVHMLLLGLSLGVDV